MPPPPVAAGSGWRLADLAERAGAQLDGDGDTRVTHVASLEGAGPGAIAFMVHPRHLAALAATRASAVIVAPDMADKTALPKLLARNPYAMYAKVTALLFPQRAAKPGVHPSAVVEEGAQVAASAEIGPKAVISAGAVIGERTRIGAGCFVGEGTTIGEDGLLYPNVTVYHACVIGPRVILHSGAVIGSDGFGNAEEAGRWIKIPQIGRVVIGADVEIGANTCVDRGGLDDTVIEDDAKLDNQIQVGHNCRIGKHTAIAGCVGIAGSTFIGSNCKIGGAAMIAGHLSIPDGSAVGAATVILFTLDKPGFYTGAYPVTDHATWKRNAVELRRLGQLARRVRALEKGAGIAAEHDEGDKE